MAPLLGALFAIFIGIMAIRPYLSYQRQSFDTVQAANTASQFRQIINAATSYVQNNCLPSENNGSVPSSCEDISVGDLQTAGLLPSNIASQGANPYGQQWNVTVSQSNGVVQALLYSSGGGQIPPQLAPEIAAETGQEGGFVPTAAQYAIYNVSADTAVGAYGHWTASAPASATPGHLVALLDVGQGGVQDNDYLYRTVVPGDKTGALNTMQANLNMGGNTISNATSVATQDASGDSTFMGTPEGANGPDLNVADLSVNGSSQTNIEFGNGGEGVTTVDVGNNSSGEAAVNVGEGNSDSSSLTIGNNGSGTSTLSIGGNGSGESNLSVGGSGSGDTSVTIGGGNSSGNANVAIGNGSGGATLTIGPSNAALIFTSGAETAGTSCSTSPVGTISPNIDGSGMPLVCANPPQTGSLVVSSNGQIIITSNSSQTGTPTWMALGSQTFTTLQEETFTPFFLNGTAQSGGVYINKSTQPLLISSNCPLSSGIGGMGGTSPLGNNGVSLNFYLGSSTSLSSFNTLTQASNMQWTLSGVSLNNGGVGSPSSSVIVPPNYAFAYSLYADSITACQFAVAY